MNLRYTCTALLLSAAPVSFAAAQDVPLYCDAMADPEAYALFSDQAPFHIDTESGFVITKLDLQTDYALQNDALEILKLLNENIMEREGVLALVIPPSRSFALEQDSFDTMMPTPAPYSIQSAFNNFSEAINNLKRNGIFAPDLGVIVRNNSEIRNDFFLSGDNHWSPSGALTAFTALANLLEENGIALGDTQYDLVGFDEVSQVGAYNRVIASVCNADPSSILFEAPIFERSETASTDLADILFSDSEVNSDRVVLVGTSFSNGGGTDVFRAGDSLAFSTRYSVSNFGVGGGSQTSSIESYLFLKSEREATSMLIWELPHYQFRALSRSSLSQIYGAALSACSPGPFTLNAQSALDNEWGDIEFSGLFLQDLLELSIPDMKTGVIQIEATYADDTRFTYELRRNDRVAEDRRPQTWRLFLSDPLAAPFSDTQNPVKLRIRAPDLTTPVQMHASACSSQL
ncbi:MAG: hypothetical protein IKG52_03550 [Rhodobacteraceae bacterium]|nr:hypothetical protein [Paracoccaceae bacterium]